MNPIALSLGPISIRWYGIIICTAIIAGLLLAVREGKRYQISSDFFTDLLLIGAPSAIIGARIYYVAFKWDYYQHHLGEILMVWNGGIAIYGALIGAIIGGYFYIRHKKYSFWRIADIAAPSLIIGQVIGRWGNFTNQEAHGGPVTEDFLRNTLHLPNFIVDNMNIDGIFYHPTFLYESLWNAAGLLLLFWLRRRPFMKAGELFASYFIWYSIGRFFIEGLRTDSLDFNGPDWLASAMNFFWNPMQMFFEPGLLTYGGNIRISQLVAIVILITAIVFIIVRRLTNPSLEYYHDPIKPILEEETFLHHEAIPNSVSEAKEDSKKESN